MAQGNEMIGQIKKVWQGLSGAQKAGVVGVTALVFGGLLLSTMWAGNPDYRTVATGLAKKDLEQAIQRLTADGITEYRVVGEGSILVESSRAADAERSLASGGIIGGSGDEPEDNGLFNGALNSKDLAERQARRAEKRLSDILTRNFEFVEHAKVSITPASDAYWTSGKRKAKAAVVVKTRGELSRHQVEAIAHTVSSGVDSLSADDVAISDTRGIMLREPNGATTSDPRAPDLEYQARLEAQKTTQAQDLLDRTLGPNKAQVRVSVDLDWTRQEVKKLEYDPESAVTMDKTKTETERTGSSKTPGGAPGNTAVNGTTNQTATPTSDKSSTVKESKSFNTTESQLVEIGGRIKRMTVGIVVDESLSAKGAEIEKLVKSAVGVDETRGDVVSHMVAKIEVPDYSDIGDEAASAESRDAIIAYAEKGLWIALGAAFLFFALRTIKKAKASLREVLATSLEEQDPKEAAREMTLEEQVLMATRKDSELAGRTLRRWLYENAAQS